MGIRPRRREHDGRYAIENDRLTQRAASILRRLSKDQSMPWTYRVAVDRLLTALDTARKETTRQ